MSATSVTTPAAAAALAVALPGFSSSRLDRPSGSSPDQLSLQGLTWCLRAYLPACLRLLALDRRARHLARHPGPARWQDVPAIGLIIWDLAREWHLTLPALGPLHDNPGDSRACTAICHQLAAIKTPALRPALERLSELTDSETAAGLLAMYWPHPSPRSTQALAHWRIQRELRAGGPPAAMLTTAMIDRIGDDLVHTAARMALRLAAPSGLTPQHSAQPLQAAHATLRAGSVLEGWALS